MARREDIEDTGIPGVKRRKKDGKYLVTLDLGRENKRDNKTGEVRLRQNKTTKVVSSLREAKHLIAESRRGKRAKKMPDKKDSLTFDEAMNVFLRQNEEEWGKDYYLLQCGNAKRLNAYFEGMDIHAIETMDVEEFFQWCREGGDFKPIADNTIKGIKSTLNLLYKWLVKAGYTDTNPASSAVIKKTKSEEAQAIDSDTLSAFLAASIGGDMSLCTAIGLVGLCGLRRGEMCGLTWDKIDWGNHRIRIDTQRKIGRDGSVMTSLPKNGREGTSERRKERWAAMPKQMACILRLSKKEQEKYSVVNETDLVYRTRECVLNQYPPSPKAFDVTFARFRDEFSKTHTLPENFRYHDLRHTFVSLCVNGGVNFFQVSASVGHSLKANAPTAISVYWHDDGNRDEINAFIEKTVRGELIERLGEAYEEE